MICFTHKVFIFSVILYNVTEVAKLCHSFNPVLFICEQAVNIYNLSTKNKKNRFSF